ncbi:hypothetical protein NGM33_28760 [Nocardiopsis dassonvillei]|uniref:hypothetical protein n=1 Tax=Nocardiopsis dassonvillei TaxID=2014 RepID=UPI0020A45ED0|nr:hypothetical protein [Nocardiopsis dassonvillei]MCP3017329.1 hypothetical protein [Nocardiopsis dassonvillei]
MSEPPVRISRRESASYPYAWRCTNPDPESYTGECGTTSFAGSRLAAEYAHQVHMRHEHEEA